MNNKSQEKGCGTAESERTMNDRTAQDEAIQNELEQAIEQRNQLRIERDSIVNGVKRDLQAVLDHPEWSLARIRMHLESIIQERL